MVNEPIPGKLAFVCVLPAARAPEKTVMSGERTTATECEQADGGELSDSPHAVHATRSDVVHDAPSSRVFP